VTEERLDRADIIICLQQVRGKTVAKRMGRNALREFGPPDGLVKRDAAGHWEKKYKLTYSELNLTAITATTSMHTCAKEARPNLRLDSDAPKAARQARGSLICAIAWRSQFVLVRQSDSENGMFHSTQP
jgi:hypothetical protein